MRPEYPELTARRDVPRQHIGVNERMRDLPRQRLQTSDLAVSHERLHGAMEPLCGIVRRLLCISDEVDCSHVRLAHRTPVDRLLRVRLRDKGSVINISSERSIYSVNIGFQSEKAVLEFPMPLTKEKWDRTKAKFDDQLKEIIAESEDGKALS